jgi:hypothetical protein
MKRSLFLLNAELSLSITLGLTGCMVSAGPPVVYASTAPPPPAAAGVTVTEDATLYPQSPPPDPVPEFAPESPGGGYVWVNGYWDWNGNDWIWADGYWAPNRAGYVYFGPRFEFVDGRAVYYRSYWAGPGGVHEYGYGYGPRREPPAAYRARPSQQPAQWRTQHNETWHQAPGAANWHGATAQHQNAAEPQRQRAEPGHAVPQHEEPGHALPQHEGASKATAQGHLEGKGTPAEAHVASGAQAEQHGEGSHPANGPAAQNAPGAHPVGPHGVVPEKTATQNHANAPAASAGHPQGHPTNAQPARKVKEKKKE